MRGGGGSISGVVRIGGWPGGPMSEVMCTGGGGRGAHERGRVYGGGAGGPVSKVKCIGGGGRGAHERSEVYLLTNAE